MTDQADLVYMYGVTYIWDNPAWDDIFPARMSPIFPTSVGSHFYSFQATDFKFFVQLKLYTGLLGIYFFKDFVSASKFDLKKCIFENSETFFKSNNLT